MNAELNHNGVIPILEIKGPVATSALDRAYLEARGFRVDEAFSLQEATEYMQQQGCAAILLDLWMSGDGGMDVLRKIRPIFRAPIFVYAAEFESTDRILAYELGADDFLATDIAPREFVARLRAGIRRRQSAERSSPVSESVILVQDIQLNQKSRSVSQDGVVLHLTRAEFDLLTALMRNSGRVCPRERLLDAIIQDSDLVLDRTVDVHIASLRRKLADNAHTPRYIRTVRSIGYSFLSVRPEVAPVDEPPDTTTHNSLKTIES